MNRGSIWGEDLRTHVDKEIHDPFQLQWLCQSVSVWVCECVGVCVCECVWEGDVRGREQKSVGNLPGVPLAPWPGLTLHHT